MNQVDQTFKAETRQLLDILIHSLYTEREIFLRELISNASDALTRVDFEILTNREALDPDAELAIWVIPDEKEGTLTIKDTGIGMNSEELVTNLGTIAHSGAREFIKAVEEGKQDLSNLIGQFGVGFYSAFMVADWIKVTSRSYRKEDKAAEWFSEGEETFRVEPTEKIDRGTIVTIKLKEDAKEFTEEHRLKEIIQKHSDFIPFPIYIGNEKEQVNRQTAIWRQSPREVEEKEYNDFYQQLTLDFQEPLTHTHLVVDAPVQMYAILYLPANPEQNFFSKRKEDGVKLYARKVLIEEYYKDLLPEYLGFIQGVVDSEDLPLNVSRQAVQSSKTIAQLKKLVTSKTLDMLDSLAKDSAEKYNTFWENYSRFIKQGIAIENEKPEALFPLLRFKTTKETKKWSSLEDYTNRMKPDQKEIYYILGDDDASALHSPHLDVVRHYDYEVLLLTDPVDAFMLVKLDKYKDYTVKNVANAELSLPTEEKAEADKEQTKKQEKDKEQIIKLFKEKLGERVTDVRMTDRLTDSPARLVDPEGAMNQEMQRVYRMLNKDYEVPKKVLELNPRHPIIKQVNELEIGNPLVDLVVEQIYEDALLIEGLHPDPASMISRIQKIIQVALE
jgi:HSP90 family molecular chaperone